MTRAKSEQEVHDQLKHSLVDNKFAATVYVIGAAHEVGILEYRPGAKSKDGKHSSKFGFVTVRDQAGIVNSGNVKGAFKEAGMDDQTFCITVEDFVSEFAGFASIVKKDF